MSTRRVTGILGTVAAFAALALAWTFFAPTQLGGGTSYAIIVGSSMEPKLHRGDLAVVRKQRVYRAGDVVMYESRELGSKVLHRIVSGSSTYTSCTIAGNNVDVTCDFSPDIAITTADQLSVIATS